MIRRASRSAFSAWRMGDICHEVFELVSKLNVSVSLMEHSANEEADDLAKKGVGRDNILVEAF